jgi:hypothetical protein
VGSPFGVADRFVEGVALGLWVFRRVVELVADRFVEEPGGFLELVWVVGR